MKRWNDACRKSITTQHLVELASVQATIDAFDFSRVTVLPPTRIIAEHQTTRYHAFRFGGGLPARATPAPAPAALQPHEHTYVKKLLDAYTDEKKTPFTTIPALESNAPPLAKHLHRSREQFFSAESLRTFSRDTVPPGTFEGLQDEIYEGIQEVYDDEHHASGYQRVIKTVQQARIIQVTGNPLLGVMHNNDRAGICHQLANDDRLTWVRAEPKKDDQ
jgi:hypothetical protein